MKLVSPSPAGQRHGILIALVSGAIFGLWPPCARAVYAHGGNAMFMVVLSTWMRAFALCGFCLIARQPLFRTARDRRNGFIGGLFQSVSILSFLASLLYVPAPIAVTVFFSHTLMLLFFMAAKREIKLDALTLGTTVLALSGLGATLDIVHQDYAVDWRGVALALTAAFATMSRSYVYGRELQERSPAVVGAENFLVAAVMVTAGVFYDAPVMPGTAAGLCWAVLGCGALTLGTFGMLHGIARLGAFKYGLFGKVEPVFTALFAALFIGEWLHPRQYAGMAMVVGSLAMYQILQKSAKVAPPLATSPNAVLAADAMNEP